MITDPISDMLTRLRNASAVHKTEVAVPYSNVKWAIAKILAAEGFVKKADVVGEGIGRSIVLTLAYEDGEPRLRSLRRVSTPGSRVYRKATELPRVLSGFGFAIVSTSSGIMTNKEARSRRLGGEVICEIF
ncbi:30S ribosomal protein S8 [Candidatus Uhrbacteria bacterium]|nr:30S ribosomal protein S8 [Candidatus Uhrbacteria bacterium]